MDLVHIVFSNHTVIVKYLMQDHKYLLKFPHGDDASLRNSTEMATWIGAYEISSVDT